MLENLERVCKSCGIDFITNNEENSLVCVHCQEITDDGRIDQSNIDRYFGKVKSTKIARLELIPKSALIALADRFELGIERKGEGAWNSLTLANEGVLTSEMFVIERLSHCIHHCYDAIDKIIRGVPLEGEEDSGAILFGGAVLAEFKRLWKEKG